MTRDWHGLSDTAGDYRTISAAITRRGSMVNPHPDRIWQGTRPGEGEEREGVTKALLVFLGAMVGLEKNSGGVAMN